MIEEIKIELQSWPNFNKISNTSDFSGNNEIHDFFLAKIKYLSRNFKEIKSNQILLSFEIKVITLSLSLFVK